MPAARETREPVRRCARRIVCHDTVLIAVVLHEHLLPLIGIRICTQGILIVAVRGSRGERTVRIVVVKLERVCVRSVDEGDLARYLLRGHIRQVDIDVGEIDTARARIEVIKSVVVGELQHRVARLRVLRNPELIVLEVMDAAHLDGLVRLDVQRVARRRGRAAVDGRLREIRRIAAVIRAEVDRVPRLNGLICSIGIAAVDIAAHRTVGTIAADCTARDGDGIAARGGRRRGAGGGKVGMGHAAIDMTANLAARNGDLAARDRTRICRRVGIASADDVIGDFPLGDGNDVPRHRPLAVA